MGVQNRKVAYNDQPFDVYITNDYLYIILYTDSEYLYTDPWSAV